MRRLDRKIIDDIVKSKKLGSTISEISKKCGVSTATVKNYTRYLGLYDGKRGPGRIKKLSNVISKEISADFKSNKLDYLSDGCKKVSKKYNINVSKPTIHRCLKESGLNCYKKGKKHDMNEDHIQKRFEFSRNYLDYNYQDWQKVIWSDESSFEIKSSSTIEYYWSEERDPLNEKNIRKQKKFGGGTVMVWGCITPHGVGELIRIEGSITSERYIKILENGLFKSIDAHKLLLKNITFMHDNASVHSSKFTKEWLRLNKVNAIEWPSCSPDLNPIENLWEILHQKVRKSKIKPENKDQLWQILEL